MAVPVADPVWQLPMYLNRDNDRFYSEKNGIFVDPNHPPQNSTGTPLTERSQEKATQDVEDSKSKGIIEPSQRFSESEFVHQDNRGFVFCIPYDFSLDAIYSSFSMYNRFVCIIISSLFPLQVGYLRLALAYTWWRTCGMYALRG